MDKLKEACQLDGKVHTCAISFSVPVIVWLIAQPHFRQVARRLLKGSLLTEA